MEIGGKLLIGDFIGVTGILSAPPVSPAGDGRIYFDSALGKFRVSEDGGAYANLVGGGALSELTDVELAALADGEVLTYSTASSKWENLELPPSVTALSALTDVDLDAPADGDVLTYESSSGKWVDLPASGGVELARDLGGTEALPEVIGLQGRDVGDIVPEAGEVLTWSALNDQWEPRLPGILGDSIIDPEPNAQAAPTLLAVRQRGDTPGMFRLAAGTILSGPTDGQTFGAVEPIAPTSTHQVRSCDAVEFNGTHYVCQFRSNAIYVFQRQSNGTWTQVYTSSFPSGSSSLARCGLYVASNGSSSVLGFVGFGLNGSAQNEGKIARSTDGTSWTTTLINLTGLGATEIVDAGACLMHRGTLYMPLSAGNHGIYQVNFLTGGYSRFGTAFGHGVGLATIYGRVFVLTDHLLQEISGGSLITRATLGNGGSSSTIANGQRLLFADGSAKLVAWYVTSTDGTLANSYWRAADITFDDPLDTSPTVTQRDSLIPADLQSGGATANKGNAGFWCFVDNEQDPGNPQVYNWWANTIAGSFSYGKYEGSTVELVGSPTGIALTDFALSFYTGGGGERISTDDTTDAKFNYVLTEAGDAGIGSWLVSWKFQSINVAHTYTARLYVSTTEGTQLSLCTLMGTATGGTRVGDSVEGCEHNAEASVNVDLVSMGIAHNVAVKLVVRLTKE